MSVDRVVPKQYTDVIGLFFLRSDCLQQPSKKGFDAFTLAVACAKRLYLYRTASAIKDFSAEFFHDVPPLGSLLDRFVTVVCFLTVHRSRFLLNRKQSMFSGMLKFSRFRMHAEIQTGVRYWFDLLGDIVAGCEETANVLGDLQMTRFYHLIINLKDICVSARNVLEANAMNPPGQNVVICAVPVDLFMGLLVTSNGRATFASPGVLNVRYGDVMDAVLIVQRQYFEYLGSSAHDWSINESMERFLSLVELCAEHTLKQSCVPTMRVPLPSVEMVNRLKPVLPLCIRSLLDTLIKSHRLPHYSRFFLTTFLSHSGLPYDETIQLFKENYSRHLATCDVTCKGWQPFYANSIKRVYGMLPGSKRSYVMNCGGFQKHGLCPYTLAEGSDLQESLNSYDLPDVEDLVQACSESGPSAACLKAMGIRPDIEAAQTENPVMRLRSLISQWEEAKEENVVVDCNDNSNRGVNRSQSALRRLFLENAPERSLAGSRSVQWEQGVNPKLSKMENAIPLEVSLDLDTDAGVRSLVEFMPLCMRAIYAKFQRDHYLYVLFLDISVRVLD